jgi:hypothetical protein
MPILIRHDPIMELAGLASNVGQFATQGVQAENRRRRDQQAMQHQQLQREMDNDLFRQDMAFEELALQKDRFGLDVDELQARREYNQQLLNQREGNQAFQQQRHYDNLDDKARADEERFSRLVYQEEQRRGTRLSAQELDRAKFEFNKQLQNERLELDRSRLNLQGQTAAQRYEQAGQRLKQAERAMSDATSRADENARFRAEDAYHTANVERAEAAYEHWKKMEPRIDPRNPEKYDAVDAAEIRKQLEAAIIALSQARATQAQAQQIREQIIRQRMQQNPATQPATQPASRPSYQIGQPVTSPDGRRAIITGFDPDGTPRVRPQ